MLIKNKLLQSTILAGLCAFSYSANATLLSGWGTNAGTYTYDYCPSYCQYGNYDFNGGAENAIAQSEITTSAGTANAYAELVGNSYLPVLKAYASANTGQEAGAGVFAAQGFTYTGSTGFNFVLNFNLHGTVDADEASLRADIGIISGSAIEYYPSIATSYYEVNMGQGLGLESVWIQNNGIEQNQSGTLSFWVNPGDSFFVLSELSTRARGGYADAWNTLTMDFTTSQGLVAAAQTQGNAPSPVPEPSSIIVLLTGLVYLLRKSINR